jgi:hypothetical protein
MELAPARLGALTTTLDGDASGASRLAWSLQKFVRLRRYESGLLAQTASCDGAHAAIIQNLSALPNQFSNSVSWAFRCEGDW